jgi:hypothetical protein
VYVVSGDGKLHAVNPVDGTQKWVYETGTLNSQKSVGWSPGLDEYSSPVIAGDGTVYVEDCAGKLHAVNPVDGTKKWVYESGEAGPNDVKDDTRLSPAIGDDGTVYIGGRDKKLHAVDPTDGAQKWAHVISRTQEVGKYYISSPAIADNGTVYVGGGDTHDNTHILSLIPPDGRPYSRFACGISAIGEYQFSPDVLPGCTAPPCGKNDADFAQECAAAFNENVCTPSKAYMQEQYCKPFENHPPYLCTKKVNRSMLAALSLAFSGAAYAYMAIILFLSHVLWICRGKRGDQEGPAELVELNYIDVVASESEDTTAESGMGI